MFLASVAALSLASADFPCCETAKDCIERLRSVKSVAEPSRPLRRSCEADFLSKNGGKVVAELLQLLAHPAWETRDAAAVALASIKPVSKQTVTALHALALREPGSWAAWSLIQINDPASATVLVRVALTRTLAPVEDPLWSAMVPLAIEALPAQASWQARSSLYELIAQHPNRARPPAEAKRLHALLLAELRKKTWVTPDCRGREEWDEPPRATASKAFDECLPLAGTLVAALERYGADANFAARAIELAGARNQYVEPFATSALVRIGAKSARERLSAELKRPELDRVSTALLEVSLVPEPGTLLDELELILARPEPQLSSFAAMILAKRGRTVSLQVLRAHLADRHLAVVGMALGAIRELGPRARELEPEVTALLSSPSTSVGAYAASALSAMLGRSVTATPPPCFTGPPLSPFDREKPVESCPAGRACVRGEDNGEFGGKLWVELEDGGTRVLLDSVNPLLILELGRQRVLIEGLAHMGMMRGSVSRLVDGDGGVRVEFVADTPGVPIGWAANGETLTLEVEREEGRVGRGYPDEPLECRYRFPMNLEK